MSNLDADLFFKFIASSNQKTKLRFGLTYTQFYGLAALQFFSHKRQVSSYSFCRENAMAHLTRE